MNATHVLVIAQQADVHDEHAQVRADERADLIRQRHVAPHATTVLRPLDFDRNSDLPVVRVS